MGPGDVVVVVAVGVVGVVVVGAVEVVEVVVVLVEVVVGLVARSQPQISSLIVTAPHTPTAYRSASCPTSLITSRSAAGTTHPAANPTQGTPE